MATYERLLLLDATMKEGLSMAAIKAVRLRVASNQSNTAGQGCEKPGYASSAAILSPMRQFASAPTDLNRASSRIRSGVELLIESGRIGLCPPINGAAIIRMGC
jgi:hypothetical protein